MADTVQFNSNLVGRLDEETRKDLALKITTWYKNDRDSRSQWEERRDEYYKLSICEPIDRVPPFEGGANICTPIVASAILSYASRAYNSIVSTPDGRVVAVFPSDSQDTDKARKVERFLNWQLISDMPEWESEMDKLLHETATFGVGWKKIMWDDKEKRPVSLMVPGVDVFVPYNTRNAEEAPRIIHRLRLLLDDIKENPLYEFTEDLQPASAFIQEEDKALPTLTSEQQTEGPPPVFQDESIDRNTLLECHVRMALPQFGDTTRQPYTITVDVPNQEVIRIVSRLVPQPGESEKVEVNHWVDYHFIPNTQGFYSYGYGAYLSQLNHVQNTIYNLAIDSGRLSNTPFIVYGRGAGLKGRNLDLRPGAGVQVSDVNQIKEIKLAGMDNAIVALMQQTEKFAQDITSNAEELQGRAQKGVREPTATGTQLRIEQGLVQFDVLTKRILRQFKKELRLIHVLNSLFLPNMKTFRVLGTTDGDIYDFENITKGDLNGKFDVMPTGDPSFSAAGRRKEEALTLFQLVHQSPMVVGMPGVVPPNLRAMRESLENLLREFDRSDLINTLPVIPDRSIPPAQENQLISEGVEVDPKPGEDHAAHMAVHRLYTLTDEYAALDDNMKQALNQHMVTHDLLREEEAVTEAQVEDAQARFNANAQFLFPGGQDPTGGQGGQGGQGGNNGGGQLF